MIKRLHFFTWAERMRGRRYLKKNTALKASFVLFGFLLSTQNLVAQPCEFKSIFYCDLQNQILKLEKSITIKHDPLYSDMLEDDPLIFEIEVNKEKKYLTLLYFSSENKAKILLKDGGPVKAGTELSFGDGSPGRGEFAVRAPFGKQLLAAFGSNQPLLTNLSARADDGDAFIEDLLTILKSRQDIDGDFVVLTTRPGG